MLSIITPMSWLRLTIAIAVFMGPGMAVVSFHPGRDQFDRTEIISRCFVYSISLWAVLLAYLRAANITLNVPAVAAILGCGWALALWRFWRDGTLTRTVGQRRPLVEVDPHRILLWAVLGLAVFINIYALRGQVVGPGSDSYHHTLITQMFADQGGIPVNYNPYADLVTFRYHYGFHAFAWAVQSLSDFRLIFLVPILAQLLVVVSALTTAQLSERVASDRFAAPASAIFAGLVLVFPAYLINWGRYTQLTGLVILPVFILELFDLRESPTKAARIAIIAILASGIALSHYRVAVMALLAAVAILVYRLLTQSRFLRAKVLVISAPFAASGILALILTSPRLVQIYISGSLGYQPVVGKLQPTAFSLSRLGGALAFPTNTMAGLLLLLAIFIALWTKAGKALTLALWGVAMFALSGPSLFGEYMDTVTVVISAYVPIAVLIGLLFAKSFRFLTHHASKLGGVSISLVLLAMVIFGAMPHMNIVEPNSAYVSSDDLKAFSWIRANVPSGAVFTSSTYEFPFMPGFIIGIDGGYWIPLLAGRQSLIPPMIFPIERSADPSLDEKLMAFYQVQERLDSPDGTETLRRLGTTYIYLSDRTATIDRSQLDRSPEFKLVYNERHVSIYQFKDQKSSSRDLTRYALRR